MLRFTEKLPTCHLSTLFFIEPLSNPAKSLRLAIDDIMEEHKNKKNQWTKTCEHLKKSFDAWEEVNRMNLGPSAAEKQMAEFRSILKDLQGKVEELSLEESPEKPPIHIKKPIS